LELVHSHEAWGAKVRVDLIWRPTGSSLVHRPTNQRAAAMSKSRATPPPLPPRPDEGEEELVTIIKSKDLANKLKQKARKLMEVEETRWASKGWSITHKSRTENFCFQQFVKKCLRFSQKIHAKSFKRNLLQ
jgi:hypothetical protein